MICKSIKKLVMKYTSSILWTCFWDAYKREVEKLPNIFSLGSIPDVGFIYLKYTRSWFSKNVYLLSNWEVYFWSRVS